jgi:hypothetical protein
MRRDRDPDWRAAPVSVGAQPGAIVRRHSLLKRHPRHSRDFFSSYYENHHGPLAARQAGFRKYTTHYLQNHVLDLPDGEEPAFDGISMTTQVPRPDYMKGFFGEPDYANVKDDELYLFDLSSTISLLGDMVVVRDGPRSNFKALFLGPASYLRELEATRAVRLIANRLDSGSASALGFRTAAFAHDLLAEIWFESLAARTEAFQRDSRDRPAGSAARILPVREVLIFGRDDSPGGLIAPSMWA